MEHEIEKPHNSHHFQGFRDFLKYYKSRLLQQNGHCNRDRHHHDHLNRSMSSVLPHNVNDKANNSENNKKKVNNYFQNNYSCFRTIVLMNGPKKKRAQSDLPPAFTTFEDFLPNPKGSLGRSRSSINNSLKSQEWGKTPENSRAPSINRTFSTGTINRANSFKKDTNNNNKNNNNRNKNGAFVVINRSTSMNISRSRSNNNMSSFGSFNKSRNNSTGVLRPSAMEMELECTLEELCYGSVKNITVSRDVYSSTRRQIFQEEEILTVNVKPGWKAGTKITFEGTTSDIGEYKADVIFLVSEKPHLLFLRNNEDLEMEMTIPLVDALTGCTLTIPLLGGDNISMAILDDVVYPGFQKLVVGQGMPNPNNTLRRGDLKVKFLVDFPNNLSEEQRLDVFNIFSGVDFSS